LGKKLKGARIFLFTRYQLYPEGYS